MTDPATVFSDFLKQCGGCAVLDGGLATELERHGADLNDTLWSAKCLLSSPHIIRRVHLDYLDAGANIIITASYPGSLLLATIQGFLSKGLSTKETESLLKRSVEIACEAREIYNDRCAQDSLDGTECGGNRSRPVLVASSWELWGQGFAPISKGFHRRVQILANSGADLIAFETIPNKLEAEAFSELLKEEGIQIPAWFSFNSKDGFNVVSGDSIVECASVADSCKQVVAVGINCTPPRFFQGLISSMRKASNKPIIIYPNRGETYDPDRKEWIASTGVADEDFVSYVDTWRQAGASLFGGCCRTTPNTIKGISRVVHNQVSELGRSLSCKARPKYDMFYRDSAN